MSYSVLLPSVAVYDWILLLTITSPNRRWHNQVPVSVLERSAQLLLAKRLPLHSTIAAASTHTSPPTPSLTVVTSLYPPSTMPLPCGKCPRLSLSLVPEPRPSRKGTSPSPSY